MTMVVIRSTAKTQLPTPKSHEPPQPFRAHDRSSSGTGMGSWAFTPSDDFDRHVRRVGDRVVDGGALLGLRDERLDVLARGVGVDLERHLDAVVTVADLGVHAEDALDVHRAFDVRFDRAQLDAAIL